MSNDELKEAIGLARELVEWASNPHSVEEFDPDDELTAEMRTIRINTEKVCRALLEPISYATKQEVQAVLFEFRRELNKRMDTRHPSASPSTEAMEIALRLFVDLRRKT